MFFVNAGNGEKDLVKQTALWCTKITFYSLGGWLHRSQQKLLMLYLIPGCISSGVRLGSGKESGKS